METDNHQPPKWHGTIENWRAKQQELENKQQEQRAELKRVANRVFSTEDGKILARAMIRGCRMLEAESYKLSDNELRSQHAYQDFVNSFITNLIDRKVFMSIIEEI